MLRLLLTLLLSTAILAQGLIINPYSLTSPCYLTANTAVFDGTNDYMRLTGNLTGIADSKLLTCSFWISFAGGDGVQQSIYQIEDGLTQRLSIGKDTSNRIFMQGWDSSGNMVLSAIATSPAVTVASGYVNVVIAVDLANSSNRGFYINGSAATVTWGTYTDTAMDLVMVDGRNVCGANRVNTSKITATLAEFWLDDVYNNVVADYYCTGGHPQDVGATGSIPTGSAPALYLSRNGSGNSWNTDSSGNGNTFTVTGSLTSGTPP